jgi:hypothetical protein
MRSTKADLIQRGVLLPEKNNSINLINNSIKEENGISILFSCILTYFKSNLFL